MESSLRGAALWDEVKDPEKERPGPVRRPAAAPVHRPRPGGQARSAADGRAQDVYKRQDNDYGSLAAGRYGNVILADKELNIKAVIQKGTRIV